MKHVVSAEGFAKLKSEWEDLKLVQRPAMQKQVSDAAAEGDRSENAAYTYGKMKLRDIDRRLRFLDKLLDGAQIVDSSNLAKDKVLFGAQVTLLETSTGARRSYKIVGTAEVDPMQGAISMDSPLGKAMMGKAVGSTIEVDTPRGRKTFTLESVQ